MSALWEWRRASGGFVPSGDLSVFHAYDVNDNAACEPSAGLAASCEEPNEGSRLCRHCIEFVKALPEGRVPNHRLVP